MRRTFSVILAAILVLSFTACATAPEAGQEVVIRLGSPFRHGHILVDAAEKFRGLVATRSAGRIIVHIEAGVASEENINERNSKGELEMQSNGHRALELFAPQYFFFNAPYVMKDFDHFMRVWNGTLGRQARELTEKNGNVRYMGIVYRGLRQTTSNKPLMTPADVAGLKLRLPTVPTWMAVWREMGAEPIPIPLTGLFAALQEGRAEASEGDLTQISSFRLNEVQTHLTMTNHLVMTGGMMINTNFLASLSRRDQTLITKAVEEASQWASDRFMATEASILADLKQRGMQIVVPDAAAFRAKGKPAVEALFRTEWPVTTWESVLGK